MLNLRSALLDGGRSSQYYPEATTTEEEFVAMQVANEALGEIDLLSYEIRRLSHMAYGLEGLMQVCSHIREATPEHVCLVEAATELAFAGTDVGVEELLPGLESSVGHTVDLEGLGTVLRNVWASIKKMLKKIWTKLKDFVAGIFSAIPKLRKAAVKMKERAEASQGKIAPSDDIEVGRLASVLCHISGSDYKFLDKGSDYKTNMNDYVELTVCLLEKIPAKVAAIEKALVKAISELKMEELHSATTSVPESYTGFSTNVKSFASEAADLFGLLKGFTDYSKSGDDRYTSNEDVSGKNVLAGRSIVFVSHLEDFANLAEPNKTYGEIRNKLSRSFQVIMSLSDSKKELPSEGKITPLSTSDCVTIADKVITLCDAMSGYLSGKVFKTQEETKEKLEAAVDKKSKSITDKTETSTEGGLAWRTVMDTPDFYRQMTFDVQTRLTSHLMLVCRAMVDVCNKSLAQYK